MKYSIIILVFSIFLNSCISEVIQSPTITRTPTPSSIVFLLDKSLSIKKYGIPDLEYNDFRVFINHLEKNGGSISFGTIGANSDKSFISLYLSNPPTPPIKPIKKDYKNGFKFMENLNLYTGQLLPEYEEKHFEWEQKNIHKILFFKNQLEALLKSPNTERNTDIFNGLNRASMHHQAKPNHNHYIFIISDGQDDVGKKLKPMDSMVALVFGSENYSKSLEELPNFQRIPDLNYAINLID